MEDKVITPSYDRVNDNSSSAPVAPAPVVPVTPSNPETHREIVQFTPEQQTRLDEIVRAAMGRAATETRQKLAMAEAKVKQLEAERAIAEKAAAPDAEESDRLRAQLQQLEREKQEVIANTSKQLRDAQVLAAANAEGFVVPSQVLRLIDIPQEADTATIEKTVREFATQNPHLVKGATKSGSGSSPSSGYPTAPQYQLTEIFGPKSDARLANRIAQTNPMLYKSMRVQAKAKGLVS